MSQSLKAALEKWAKSFMSGRESVECAHRRKGRDEMLDLLWPVIEAAETLSELADVPEHAQDEEWYARKREADNALTALREKLDTP